MNCDALSPWYAAIERVVFGRALERCREHFLDDIGDARRALLIGDGDGRFLKRLLKMNPRVEVDCVDVSQGMLTVARSVAGTDRVRYVQMDALRGPWPAVDYDLVVTHFVFDCFDADGQRVLAGRVPRARWLVSEFRRSGPVAGLLISTMYAFFRMATGLRTHALQDHREALDAAGYQMAKLATHRGGMLVSELWEPRWVE